MRRRAASTSARSGTAMFIRGAAPGPARSGNNAGRAWSGRRSRCTTRTCDSNSHALPEAPSRTRFRFSAAARRLFPARVEDLAVQVYVESDGRVTVRDGEHGAAEGAERVWPGALLPGTAHVTVFGILGFTDPLAGGSEVIPAARRGAGQRGTDDPVLATALELGREAGVVRVALLDHRTVRVLASPPGQVGRVLPQRGHPGLVDQVERVGQEVLHVARGEAEAGGGRRVEAVDVVQLVGVEPLPRAHGDALAQNRLERVELAQVDPALLGEAEVDVPEGAGRKIGARGRIGAVVLPGQVEIADRARVGQGARLPAGLDRGDVR